MGFRIEPKITWKILGARSGTGFVLGCVAFALSLHVAGLQPTEPRFLRKIGGLSGACLRLRGPDNDPS